MGKLRNCGGMIAGGLAAVLALIAPATAAPIAGSTDTLRASADRVVVPVRWVRVPRGILAGVATGSIPGGPRLRTVYPPYPLGFEADPYFTPPAVVTVPPPLVFAPAPIAFAPPPIAFAPPFLYDIPPVWLPFGGGCFVPSDNVGQHGYFGSCAEAFYRQWTSRPD